MHFVDFLATRFGCEGFARIKEILMDDSSGQSPDCNHNLLFIQF